MASERLKIDKNYKGVSAGVTSDANQEIRMLRLNADTNRLLVDATITTGMSAQTGILADDLYDAGTNTGVMILGGDGTNYRLIKTDADGHLQVDILSGTNEQYADNTIVSAAYKGNLTLGTDGSNYQILSVNSAGRLQIDISSITAGDTNIGNVDIVSLPAGNLGMQAMTASLSIVPASDITDATYIGDIKFGESLPAGTNAIGKLAANTGVDIGDVDVTSIAAGDNNIGNVDIVTLPADPLGANADAAVAAGDAGSINAHLRSISRDLVTNIVLAAGTNAIGKLAANTGVDIGDVDILSIAAGDNNIGNVDIVSLIPGTAATNLGKAEDAAHTSGDTGVYMLAVRDDAIAAHSGADGDYESLHTDSQGALWVRQAPAASGGLTIFRSIDLDETEEEVKATAGQIYGWYIYNNATTTRYVKIYNATAANVTVGTTAPVITIPVPAGAAANVFNQHGIAFSTAITVAATTAVADNDTGAPAANDVVINVFYN